MSPLLLGDENFDFPLVEGLIELGFDIITMNDLELDNQSIPDQEVLKVATDLDRAVITFNRRDFIRLHRKNNQITSIQA